MKSGLKRERSHLVVYLDNVDSKVKRGEAIICQVNVNRVQQQHQEDHDKK